MDVLQYYSVGVGKLTRRRGAPRTRRGDRCSSAAACRTTAGRSCARATRMMGSNFGGDGGDTIVDPNNGCNIVQEYVYLAMAVTNNCANPGPDHPNAFLDLVGRDDDRHLAARRQRAVHRAVHRRTKEHQPMGRRRHEPLVPAQGLRDHVRRRVAEGLLAAVGRPDVHGGRVLRRPAYAAGAARAQQRRSAFTRGAVVGTFAGGHVDVRRSLPGGLPEPLPAGRGDRPERLERRLPRRQRVLPPLHRGPGRRRRPRLRVAGRRRDLDRHLGETSRTSRSTTSSRSRAAASSRHRPRCALPRPGVDHLEAARSSCRPRSWI